eukprot:166338-Hanusia_phi.AAC.1
MEGCIICAILHSKGVFPPNPSLGGANAAGSPGWQSRSERAPPGVPDAPDAADAASNHLTVVSELF